MNTPQLRTLLLLAASAIFAFLSANYASASITEIGYNQSYWMQTDEKGNYYYKKRIPANTVYAVTLQRNAGNADFDVYAYSDSNFKKTIRSGKTQGATSELFILPIKEYPRYVYLRVQNYSGGYGKYSLYIDEINVAEIFGEALAISGLEYLVESFLGAPFDVDSNSSSSARSNANRVAVGIVSNLQGKDFAATSKTLLINELRREVVGDGFLSSFAVNFGVAYIEKVYQRY